jgi:hypothetical protein
MAGTLKVGGVPIATHSDATAKVTLDSGIVFPAGHILQVSHGAYQFTGDVGVTTTSEVFGPVISMQMINANANIFCILSLGELYAVNVNSYIRLAYKTTTFTAGQGNTAHGATIMTQDAYFKFRYAAAGPSTIHMKGNISNSAGDTIYFAPEGFVWGGGTFYPNYGGTYANLLLTIMEIA